MRLVSDRKFLASRQDSTIPYVGDLCLDKGGNGFLHFLFAANCVTLLKLLWRSETRGDRLSGSFLES